MTEPATTDPGTLVLQDRSRLRRQADAAWMARFAPEPEPKPEPERSAAGRALSDIGTGIGEAGTQILGGVRDAAAGALHGIAAFDEWASDALGLPKLQILNDEGAFDPALLSAEEGRTADVLLPEVRQPKSVTGGLIRGVSQFLTGFAAGGRALKSLNALQGAGTGTAVARAAAASALSDFGAFDGHEARLSDLIQSFPALENPVTEYLASDQDDSELEGRLKNVAEGALSDAAITGLVSALRGVRAARRLRAGTGAETYAEAQRRLARDPRVGQDRPGDLSAIRAPDAPLTFTAKDISAMGDDLRAYVEGVGPRSGGKTAPGTVEEAGEEVSRALMQGRIEGGSTLGADGVPSAPDAELIDMVRSGASPEQMERHPALAPVMDDIRAREPTHLRPDYGTDEFWRSREYAADGRALLGKNAAVDYLYAKARDLAWAGAGDETVGAVATDRKATILIGAPASGKSTIAETWARARAAAIIDADEAKKLIPEFEGGIGAQAVHEESSDLIGEVLKRATGNGDNLVLPKVGGSPASIEALVELLKGRGYNVDLVLIDLPSDEAWRRMLIRHRETGRLIAPDVMRDGIDGARGTYDTLKQKGIADGYARIDNGPPRGQAREIAEDPGQIVPADLGRDGTPGRGTLQADHAGTGGRGRGAGPDGEQAPGLTPAPDPTARPGIGRIETAGGDVYVNWARIDTLDDVRAVIQQMADAGRDEIDAARRGVRSNAETALAAEREDAWQLLVERRDGQPLNAEQTLALRRLWASSGEQLTEAARRMQDRPTAENAFLLRRAMALHGTVQREVLAVRTETARALQQWSIPSGPDELVSRRIRETVDMFGSEDLAEDIAGRIVDLADAREFGAIDDLSRKGALAATGDAVFEYWVNAILSGPKTHLVNSVSNLSVILMNQAERLAAAQIGGLRGAIDGVDAAEAGAMLHASIAALPDAWRFAGRAFMTGESGFGLQKLQTPRTRSISTETLASTRNRAFNKAMNLPLVAQGINALGSVVTVPGRALGAADEFFKTINYRMEVHALAARQARRELGPEASPEALRRRMAEIAEDPPAAAAAQARDFAQYSTFTNKPGPIAGAINQMRGRLPLLRFVMPFVNTPANIIRFTLERSPAGLLLGDVRADIRAGGARADLALARLGLGSVAMLTAYDAAMNGAITGAGPADHREKGTLRRTGWQPYSVRIGDRWFAYNRLDPMGALMGIAANMAELSLNSQDDPGADYDEAVYGAIAATGQHMLDRTYLQGLSDLFTAMAEPKRRGAAYFERLAASFVPAFMREIEAAVDPELRRSSDTLELIRSRIPGLSSDLPARHDLWGREISFQSGLGRSYDAVSPIYSSREDAQPIDRELIRLGYFPGLPSSRMKAEDGPEVVMRNLPQVYERLVVLQGATPASALPPKYRTDGKPNAPSARLAGYGDATLMETLNAIVTGRHALSGDYAAADGDGQVRLIERTIADYREGARRQLVAEHPDIFTPEPRP